MIHLVTLLTVLVALKAIAQEFTAQFPIERSHFSAFGGHPYFILNPGHRLVLAGQEAGDDIVLTVTALNQTKTITLTSRGQPRRILARVVEEREVLNGALNQVDRFWYARSIENGDVYLFGAEVDFYFNGEIVGQTLLWQAGVDGALPGIIMPGTFLLGARYYQSQAAPALDVAENLAMGLITVTPAGTFSNCVQILETDTLRPETGIARKTYAPGIGVVNDDDILLLQELRLGTQGLPAGCTFTPFSHHPLFPFSPGRILVLEGREGGRQIVRTITALDEIRVIPVMIAGVERTIPTRIIEERETADAELVELSRKFFAQCLETGDVHYFGREIDRYVDGVVAGHEGSWIVGVEGAEAGMIMPGHPTPGSRYAQETVPGVADQLAVISASGLTVNVSAGTFTNCVRISLTNLLGGSEAPRERIYAPGVGLISEGNVLSLTSFTDPNTANGAPVLSIQEAVLLTWPLTDQPFYLQGSSDLQNWMPIGQIPQTPDGRNQVAIPADQARSYFRLHTP